MNIQQWWNSLEPWPISASSGSGDIPMIRSLLDAVKVPDFLDIEFTAKSDPMSWVPKADCFALGFISQVVSPRFADIIRVHVPESDLQLIPVPIRHHESGSILHGYCIVNVLRVVDCVDLKKSSAVLSEDINGKFSYEFHRLGPVLDLGKIPADVMVFRLHQALNYVLINEEFAALVKKHKIRKFPFRKVRIELL